MVLTLEICLAVLSKAEHMCTLWPSYSAYVHLKTHAKMFTVTLFILTKIGKLKYLSVVEWSNVGMNHVQIVGFICQIVKYWQQYIFFNWYIVYINTVTTIQQCGWRFITTCNDMFIGWKFHLKNMRLAKKKKKPDMKEYILNDLI